ncbi:MAG TPA: alkaline phosphatase family protein [Solirubrobacteraceae bacterium]
MRRWEERFGALPLPSPLAWGAMAAAFLGFGVLMGNATGGSVGTLASARTPVKVLVAQSNPVAPTSSTPASKPPPAETESTPEPSTTTETAKTTTSASSGKSSSSSSSGTSAGSSGSEESSNSTSKLPSIKHVWVVMLSEEPYATAFGPASPAHYLTGTLEKQGTLLVRYYAVAHEGLADRVGMLSGQGPTEATAADCPTYADIASTGTGAKGQVLGTGCVYPSSTKTLMGQLTAKKLTWKAYVEGEGEGGVGTCAHPKVGAPDPSATAVGGYQTWRNPFVYFQGVTESPSCASHDVGLKVLQGDLSSSGSTANFSYIAPGPCDDGAPQACSAGKTSGMASADTFLKKTIPEITSSRAYKKDGLIAITIDQAPTTGEYADSSSCCGQPKFENLPPASGAAALAPPGGGQVGMLLLSPFIKKGGALVQDTYNHFSFLATVEQLFGLSKLGYAGLSEVKTLSPSVFSGE